MSGSTISQTDKQPFDVPKDRRPKHIAIIMDGNGRWARRNKLPRIEGHRRGTKTVRLVVEQCARLDIRQLTLYCLSSENWKRPQEELDFLMHMLQQYLIEERSTLIEHEIHLRIIGRRDRLPDEIRREMDRTLEMTKDFHAGKLCLAINYGGRAEIVDAVRSIAHKAKTGEIDPNEIDEQTISDHLYTAGLSDPDLLIRTAGEMRISNFLLWQISYAELWVTDRCWPEFRVEDFHQAIRDFASRERRFGGLADKGE